MPGRIRSIRFINAVPMISLMAWPGSGMTSRWLSSPSACRCSCTRWAGRISRGFDFLGYAFSPEGLAVAAKTVARFAERVTRLYEQGADDLCIGAYVRRWQRWVVSGLGASRPDVEARLPAMVPAGTCFTTACGEKSSPFLKSRATVSRPLRSPCPPALGL